jgi:transcriptional regulator with GAF, ATPase, and Fis domain
LTESERRWRDRDNLIQALRKTRGRVFGSGGAAELLGIKPTTLASRIKRWNLDLREFKRQAS